MPVRILIAAGSPIILRGLREFLASSDSVTILGEAHDGPEAVRQIDELRPDVAVLDIGLPVLSGVSVLERIRGDHSTTRVIFISREKSAQSIRVAFRAGASGYVFRDDDLSTLPEIVCAVHAGEVRVSPSAMHSLLEADPVTVSAPPSRAALSPREQQVLELIASGRHSRDVAEALNISARTVDTHRANIMKKLGVHSVVDLVRYALRGQVE